MESQTAFLGFDLGTTHIKAGLFSLAGDRIRVSYRPTPVAHSGDGRAWIDPDELWRTAVLAAREALESAAAAGLPAEIAGVGIASMAETGLFVDRQTGEALSPFLPWFDAAAEPQAAEIRAYFGRSPDRFLRAGIRPSFKCSLAKILWWRARQGNLPASCIWLSTADYLAYRLTGAFATDYSLAGRTLAFRIDRPEWDADWLAEWNLSTALFPEAHPAGRRTGQGARPGLPLPGLKAGTPVVIGGHDHICGSFAAGIGKAATVYDSIGTAETVLGVFPRRSLEAADESSGLAFGCAILPDHLYWLGGNSAAGGSIEWLRNFFGPEAVRYETLDQWMSDLPPGPGEILFFPYFLGSGSPHSHPAIRAAFIGLSAHHKPADLYKAVLEGTAYEMEYIRRAGEQATRQAIRHIRAAGGGARNSAWLQIRADLSGCIVERHPETETTLLGAALLAAVGAGGYTSVEAAAEAQNGQVGERFFPDTARGKRYQDQYARGYLALQGPLRETAERLAVTKGGKAG